MIRTLIVLAILTLAGQLTSQEAKKTIFICPDSLMIQADEDGRLFVQWHIGSQTDLHTIAEAVGIKPGVLTAFNPILRFRDIEPCDLILAPFDIRLLMEQQTSESYPIYYRVRQGETVFGIARRILDMPVEKLRNLNVLPDDALRTGQLLIVGYASKTSADLSSLREAPTFNSPEVLINDVNTAGKHFATHKGVAWWNKSKPDPNLFALHRTAPVNSLIEIRNPMFNRSVWAKVIGKIPVTYAEDISVIVSQGVANSLGAIDGRFYVEVSYEVK